MCGISGIINKNNADVKLWEIKAITDVIAHRGPDGEGFLLENNFALGHRRLAIIDTSADGDQPMWYENKYAIVFNGEIYNYLEIREQLVSLGYLFTTGTDTEVILAAYDYWGVNCVSYFNGMWAFALYDKKQNTIFCSRDRFGIKPFYYSEFKGNFYFASEIKQFTVLQDWESVANIERVYDFFVYGVMNHTTETCFKNIFQLPGGCNLLYSLDNHKYEINKWYLLEAKGSNYSEEQAVKTVSDLFLNSINLHLRSDVKVGSCLSGGIDSSAIVCAINQNLKSANNVNIQETVSAVYNEIEFSEERFVDIVVESTHSISHKVTPNFEDLFSQLDTIIWHQDEPFTSTSIFAQWNVFKEASKHNLKVMLDGQGADEYLAGYHTFFGVYLFECFKKLDFFRFFKELKSIFSIHGSSNGLNSLFWFGNCILYNLPFVTERLRIKIKAIGSNTEFKWLKISGGNIVEEMYKNSFISIKNYSNYLLNYITIPTLLHYEDRNSMAFSIESRVPFLDYKLVEFVYSLPSKFKIKEARTKYVFIKAMNDMLPNEIANRKDKVGFATPQILWVLENEDFFRKEIENSCDLLNTIIDKDEVMKLFNSSIKAKKPSFNRLWNIICLAHWVKVFKVKIDINQ